MNSPTGTLYTGMTGDLFERVRQHKNKEINGFTKKYYITRLTYYEEFSDSSSAIQREKQIKNWRRSKKIDLIKSINPKRRDLAADWYDDL
jgi:putative endonuclease